MGGKSFEACGDVAFSGTTSRVFKGGTHEPMEADLPVHRPERLCGEKLAPTKKDARAELEQVVNGYCAAHSEIKNCKIEKMGKIDIHEVKPEPAGRETSLLNWFFLRFNKPF